MNKAHPKENGCLVFKFADILHEILAMQTMASGFLTPEGKRVLVEFHRVIEEFSAAPVAIGRIEIPASRPVTTLMSSTYKPNTGGGMGLIGSLSGCWEIRKFDPQDKANRGRFRTVGLASWKVTLRLAKDPNIVAAAWNFDLGAKTAPGCFFHVQVDPVEILANNEKSDLDVPRFPSLLVTPMDALAFLLGELFQDEWPFTAEDGSKQPVKTFRALQLTRMRRLIEWSLAEIDKGSGVPWANLKSGMPHDYSMF